MVGRFEGRACILHCRGWHGKVEEMVKGAKCWQGSGVGGAILARNVAGGIFCEQNQWLTREFEGNKGA